MAYRKGASIIGFTPPFLPFIVLYHQNWLFAATDKLSGFKVVPDGLIRPQGLQLKE